MNNPSLRRELGRNASEYVKSRLSWKKYAEQMESVFEKTIGGYAKK
jgi:glycosyltransferase involved in cell wall biosynthesis